MTKKRKRKVRGFRVFLIIVLLILIAVAAGLFWYASALKPAGKAEEEQTVTVAAGETWNGVLEDLKEKNLIKSDMAAQIYTKLSHEGTVYEGDFKVNSGMSTPEILRYLSNPENIEKTYAVVTVPEGTWAKQIAEILAKAFPEYTAQQFIDLWNDDTYINELAKTYTFLNPQIVENQEYFVKLEGYLFPETYYIDYGSTPDQITRTFLDQFQKVYDANKESFDASGMSVEEILTLASIVQFESGDPAQMPDIAEVFYNRMEQNMPLQSSVTVCYALYDEFSSANDCETNTQIDSPYNTYINNGLPPGPILNPGEQAIEAVLHPAENDYLYFVSDIHGDGSIHYATTYEEHLANIDKYNLNISSDSSSDKDQSEPKSEDQNSQNPSADSETQTGTEDSSTAESAGN